jgi:DNA-binding NarL/FixJ family response regulator
MAEQKSRILIVDDHPMVLEGLALRINRETDLLACCQATDAESALASCKVCEHQLALVDLRLADSSGLMLIRQLRAKYPQMLILAISMSEENVYAERALRAGAQGYIMKHEATDTLIHAIRLILNGQLYVSDKMRTHLIRLFISSGDEKSTLSCLSPTEFEVFNLLAMNQSTREIAEKLNRSAKTVDSHCANMRKKLGLQNGRELNQYAAEWSRAEQDTAISFEL